MEEKRKERRKSDGGYVLVAPSLEKNVATWSRIEEGVSRLFVPWTVDARARSFIHFIWFPRLFRASR